MRKTLPPFYYLDHFKEFLDYFEGENACLLPDYIHTFINEFRQLNRDEQAVLVRIANRKHPVIAIKSLQHEEIEDPEHCIQQLLNKQLISKLDHAPIVEVANALTKSELVALLKLSSYSSIASSSKKEDVARIVCQAIKPEHLIQFQLPYIYRQFDDQLKFLLFVYFGHTNGRLNQFSMRDLGVMRTRADAVTGEGRFDDAKDTQGAYFYAMSRRELTDQTELNKPNLSTLPEVTSAEGKRQRSRYLYELGKAMLANDRAWALDALLMSDTDEGKERWIREQYKDGNKTQVKNELEALIDSSCSEKLLVFAEDFYARKFKQKRTSLLTDMMRESTHCLDIDIQYNQQVEQGIVDWYKRKNVAAWRTENQLWRSLFGLTFWSILYEQNHDGLCNEFDRFPAVLKHNVFYTTHQDAIDNLLAGFTTRAALFQHLLKNTTQHFGKSNSLFMWRSNLLDRLKILIDNASVGGLISYLKTMAQDFANLSDGYPDIMVLENKLRFEEIKAPGDKLRRNQLLVIQALKRHGFDVQVTQVNWIKDPMQPYVVVDIETTGGKAATHRITEVGMVKVINGEQVDSWQSLVNPDRHIPSAITRLTGISNAMVEDAPRFSDIAEAIDEFSNGAIFVAHNVNFDLGFIKQEFARLDINYRRPKLCTVQLMRKAYPGLPSYSLANLTTHFGIKMSRHHRAMSDAIAASELLKLAFEAENT